jgi:LPXTG-motif cell wall-anchored protein
MPGCVGSPQASSVRAAEGRSAGGAARPRLGTVMIALGVLSACVGNPAALVSAQSSAPEVEAGTVEVGDVAQPAASPPPTRTNPPSQAPPPVPSPNGSPGTETERPPAQGPGEDASTDVLVAQSTSAKTSSVSIQDGNSQSAYRFAPSSITVAGGDTVTWTNDGDLPHDVSGSGLQSGTLSPGQDYSHTFNSTGSFSYICSIHPSMKGSVTVKGGGGGGQQSGSGSQNSGDDTGVTGPGSESDAVGSAGAAGSDTQLPSTGQPVTPLVAVGGALIVLGALMRRHTRIS